MSPVRAVIRSGHLELLDALDFPEGTNLVILPVTSNEEDHKFWRGIADHSLARVWDNPEEDVYADLLKVRRGLVAISLAIRQRADDVSSVGQ